MGIMINVLIGFQLSHCPHIWMYHDYTANTNINKSMKRALKFLYKNSCVSFLGRQI